MLSSQVTLIIFSYEIKRFFNSLRIAWTWFMTKLERVWVEMEKIPLLSEILKEFLLTVWRVKGNNSPLNEQLKIRSPPFGELI